MGKWGRGRQSGHAHSALILGGCVVLGSGKPITRSWQKVRGDRFPHNPLVEEDGASLIAGEVPLSITRNNSMEPCRQNKRRTD